MSSVGSRFEGKKKPALSSSSEACAGLRNTSLLRQKSINEQDALASNGQAKNSPDVPASREIRDSIN